MTVNVGDLCNEQMVEYLFEKTKFDVVIHLAAEDGAAQSLKDPIKFVTANKQCLLSLLEVLKNHTVSTCTSIYMYIYIRAGKKVPIFKPLSVCYALKAKFLPSKLRCNAHFNNVCTCTLVQYKCVINNVAVFNIDKKCEPSNIYLFLLMKLQMLFSYLRPSLIYI